MKREQKKTIESIIKERSGEAIYADFSQINAVEAFFNAALDFLGGVDILVNNKEGLQEEENLL